MDLYKTFNETKYDNKPLSFRESIRDFCAKMLDDTELTDDQRQKIARLIAYIDINLKEL